MAEIVLATLNAKYIHSSFGLRYLHANLGELRDRAVIREFEISDRASDICETILADNPRIAGFGVYIWNAAETFSVIQRLRKIRPDLLLIVGGPEVSFEPPDSKWLTYADSIICGEADHTFRTACEEFFQGAKPPRLVRSPTPKLDSIALPYDLYTDKDVATRIIYVEASRGCPFTCEYCLSSIDIPVRQFPLERVLDALQRLYERGVRHFKFVDRTFNLHLPTSRAILEFFLTRMEPGMLIHFEMIPDRFPAALREVIAQFPPGSIQLEVGIQSFNPEVGKLISRRQNFERLEDNFQFLRSSTGVHIHADLIVGLPGETLESFQAGFDRLITLQPQEIQVGILKLLKGTPIARHNEEWQMVYSDEPPYELLCNRLVDFQTMQRMKRFSRFWDLLANSGNFLESHTLIWRGCESPFAAFLNFSDWIFAETKATAGIALSRLATHLYRYLVTERGLESSLVIETLERDFVRCGRAGLIEAIHQFLGGKTKEGKKPTFRQARHLGNANAQPANDGSSVR